MRFKSYLQKLGRALLLPVAVLPAAAIFLRFGSADLLGKYLGGDANVLREAGLIAFKFMPLIFAAGVALGIADDGHGTAVLASILAFYTLSLVGAQWSKMFYGAAPQSWDIGTLGGVVAGVIAGETYNKFKNIKLPDVFAFFAAKRFVPMATLFFSVIVAALFGAIWPTAQEWIKSFYNSVASLPKPGQTAVYITTERLLIPFGLHHILNALFIFDANFGDSIRFFKGTEGAGYIMAGAYPLKMFILPALAAAFVVTAKKENKNRVKALMVSGALVTFLTGITEPIEFAFLFAQPVLYLVYALWAGLWGAIATAMGALHGYGFSAGLIDYVLNFGIATKPMILMLVGAASGVISFFFFTFVIKKGKLKTPGREEKSKDDSVSSKKSSNTSYSEKAKVYFKALGGKSNILESSNCATRLRLKVKDSSKVNVAALKNAGAVEVIKTSKSSVQVIVGPTVQYLADEVTKLL